MAKKKFVSKKVSTIKTRPAKKMALAEPKEKPRCGLCGATKNLTKTECCHRNHRRDTLCGYHYAAQHDGKWQDCPECSSAFETEMYVYYGTNEFNFEVLENPPEYEPTKCAECGVSIALGVGGYMISGDDYWCDRCSAKRM